MVGSLTARPDMVTVSLCSDECALSSGCAAVLTGMSVSGVSCSVGQSPEWIAFVSCCRFSESRQRRLVVAVRNSQ